MRFRLFFFFLLATAFSATAQPEIHFWDGTIGAYPVLGISQYELRFRPAFDQVTKIPLSRVQSIRFDDGCTLYFEEGRFQFDRLVQPAVLHNRSGDIYLEDVLKLNKTQVSSLMGQEKYRTFRSGSNLMLAGGITALGGFGMVATYLGFCVTFHGYYDASPLEAFLALSPTMKWVTGAGAGLLIAGVTMIIVGNVRCNRIVATYNNGLGLAYTF